MRATCREVAVAALLVVCATQVLVENAAVPAALKPERRPPVFDAVIGYPRIFQGWSMFAPEPPLSDGRLVIDGVTPATVLIRGIGPTLATYGVTGSLADPQLTLFRNGALIAANDDWGGDATLTATFAQVGAFTLAADSRDAALIATLPPGAYTAQVAGADGTTGVALVEVYLVPAR